MNQSLSFGGSLLVSLFSMSVVFVVLIIIAVCIYLLSIVVSDKTQQTAKRQIPVSEPAVLEEKEDFDEVVAVITATLTSYFGNSYFKVNSIKRLKEK